MTPPARRCRSDLGQSTVELALVLPVVALFVLVVVQVGVVVHDQLLLAGAAREGARAAIVTDGDAAARRAVTESPLEARRLTIEVDRAAGTGGLVTVELRYAAPTEVPGIGDLLPDVELVATATMRSEQP